MARSYFSHSIADRTGNRIANAKVNVFLSGTSTPVSDMFAGASGGSAVTFLTSDARGFVSGYVDTPKALKFVVTDNTDTAYYAGAPTQLVPFDDLTYDPVYVYENPGDGETDDTTLATLATAVTGIADHLADTVDAHDAAAVSYAGPFAPTTVEAAIDALTLTGTFADRPAAGTAGRRFYATNQGIEYRDNGSAWVRQAGDPKDIWVTDYGALIDSNGAFFNGTDDRAAWVSAFAAAASTGQPIYCPHGSTGISRISSGITVSSAGSFVVIGQGGKNGVFGFGGQVELTFDTGGLVFNYGQSGTLRLHNLYIIGVDAPGLHMNNSASFSLHNTTLRGYGAGQPGLKSTDNFFVYADHDCSFMSGDTSTPSVLIEATGDTSPEAWDYYFDGVRLNIGTIKVVVNASAPGGHSLGNFTFENMLAENCAAMPIVDLVFEPGSNMVVQGVRITNSNFDDSSGTCEVLRVTNNSGLAQTVSAIHIAGSAPSGAGKTLQFVGPNAVDSRFCFIASPGASVGTSAGTPNPKVVMLAVEGFNYFSASVASSVIDSKLASDTVSRFLEFADGKRELGPGGSTARDVRVSRSGTNQYSLDFLNTASQGTVRFNSPASNKDMDLQFLIGGVVKGDIYAENTTGELRFYKGVDVLRIDTSKIGFLGAAPVVQQTLGAAATDLATVITLANNIRTALINLGLGQT